ncbi:MAG TPA: aminotransferase class I/II-fold pyridoxal phosphate-dependent enzyme [Azospirillaceae bacterium]|nr:aminotransferase class I/II-fold pyridoxal phosphate-dependent enzyme [Azospirillaceae bacterium]
MPTAPKTGQSASRHPDTLLAQTLAGVDPVTRAVVPAIHMASTYERRPEGGYDGTGRTYARADNPTFEPAEELLAALEGGERALLFSSGMAAATAVFMALKPGDHVVAPRVMYWALRKWLTGYAAEWGLETTLVDMTDLDALRAAVRPGATKIVWAETPANPTWDVTDLAAAAEIARAAGARLAVDNTVPTPLLTRPLDLGANIVMHAATKYLNGHSDVVAGALVGRADDEYWRRIVAVRAAGGAILGTMEAWLLQRGMRTLSVRLDRAQANAARVAAHFEGHKLVAGVLYPGLHSHPGHAVAARQMRGGFGAMLSLRVKAGREAALKVPALTEVWKHATSLGGVESLMEHRASVEGPDTPAPPDLLRLSCGIESAADLIADLEQALERASR